MRFLEFIWAAVVVLGVFTIFKILPFDTAVNAVVISLALLALVWIHIARRSLSKGSSLRKFASYLFYCMAFLFLFPLWELMPVAGLSDLVSQALLGLAYIFLVIASYRLMKIGTEFGFSNQAKSIRELIRKRKAVKAARVKRKSRMK